MFLGTNTNMLDSPNVGILRVLGFVGVLQSQSKRRISKLLVAMEHGAFGDQSNATFSITEEDHTLANAVRFTLNQDPRVTFCGYSIPHPSDARVNIRVQTTGDPAREVLKDACQDLMLMCQHVRSTVDKAVADFKTSEHRQAMNID